MSTGTLLAPETSDRGLREANYKAVVSVSVKRFGRDLAAGASCSVDVSAQGNKIHRARRSVADHLGQDG